MIKVSVCTVTYNHEKYITQCIESVLMQITNFDIEIIIGEDCSIDNTRAIIESYRKKYPNVIKPIYHDKNVGAIRNSFEFCIPKCSGQYIAALEGDDYWTDPDKLQKQVAFLEANPDYIACYHEAQLIDDEQKEIGTLPEKGEEIDLTFESLLEKNRTATASVVFKNILNEEELECLRNMYPGDWALYFLLIKYGKIKYLDFLGSVYRLHKKGAWSSLTLIENLNVKLNFFRKIKTILSKIYHIQIDKKIEHLINEITEVKNNENLNTIKKNKHRVEFLNPKLSIESMDTFFVRKSILKAIDFALSDWCGILVDLGCGEMPYRQHIISKSKIIKYIGIDIENPLYQQNVKPDMFWDGKKIPLEENSVDTVMATELFEHLPDIQSVLNEIHRVLKPGGILFFTVPFLWPLHDVPHDEYRYTPFALKRHLKTAGLDSIKIKPYGGWNASMAQMLGLWLTRSALNNEDRKKLSESFFPFYRQLLETDIVSDDYKNGPMIPGFSGTAKKTVLNISDKLLSFPRYKIQGDKLKAIIIVYYFPKLTETFILDQITGLIDQDIDIEIWAQAISEEELIHPVITHYNLFSKVKYIQFPENTSNTEKWKEEFIRINKVSINENDLFHVHFGQNFIAFQNLFMCINNPVIVSFHGLDASQYIQQKGSDCYTELFNRADLIITPSYEMQNVLLSIGCNKNKMLVHRYGVDANTFIPKARDENDQIIKLLTVARLVEKKGIEYSLRAFAEVNPANVFYKIIGEGPLEEYLKNLVNKLEINNKVFFLGSKTKEEIVKEMSDADIYVLTSMTASDGDKEGLPVTLIEAQSAGLPVLSTLHAGIPEIIRDNQTGFLCEEKNIKCIADKLKILVNNPDVRKKFSEQAREHILEEFNLKKLNTRLYKLYKMTNHNYQQNAEPINICN